ncbi:alkylhydroperoxidase AhpD family core domain-containing protein [Haladaptatus litoreus]|uniref:Alkylhydroperoxidase AhpD family core domain-containing protein n=2 Tax=Haladaptatus litoreus TaxID=553468 RepID=A0A1N7BJQ4_9EURY|nr:alkylhydroperoxidase AhpD family core domain-containing protein [Haladaptatus litoreus]
MIFFALVVVFISGFPVQRRLGNDERTRKSIEGESMVSTETRNEIEEHCGLVPTWIENLSEPASDHSWALVRDLEFGETELSAREKALIGVGVSAAIKCPYCSHFHKEEARMEDVTEVELEEAVNLASTTQYFSTVLHGSEVEMDGFVEETAEMIEYIEEQRVAAEAD